MLDFECRPFFHCWICDATWSSEYKDCRKVPCSEGTPSKFCSLRLLLKDCSGSGSNGNTC
ncbi:unnamed protein product [Prunus brigantina]